MPVHRENECYIAKLTLNFDKDKPFKGNEKYYIWKMIELAMEDVKRQKAMEKDRGL